MLLITYPSGEPPGGIISTYFYVYIITSAGFLGAIELSTPALPDNGILTYTPCHIVYRHKHGNKQYAHP
jgi:hypothetical protein